MDLNLRGKVALVTGSSRGIGKAIARALLAEGCAVAICGRDAESLEAAARDLETLDAPVAAVAADVCRPDDAARLVAACVGQLGGLDILVNSVGGALGATRLFESTDEDWRGTFELNVVHTVRMMRLAVPHMRDRGGGAVVNVASISGWVPQLMGRSQSGAAKAALIFGTERWALEFVPAGVRVNTVSPGSIIAPGNVWDLFRRQEPEIFAEYEREGFPMGRLGTPEEVADVVAFLCSPRANWINGRHIAVDGLEQPVARRDQRPF